MPTVKASNRADRQSASVRTVGRPLGHLDRKTRPAPSARWRLTVAAALALAGLYADAGTARAAAGAGKPGGTAAAAVATPGGGGGGPGIAGATVARGAASFSHPAPGATVITASNRAVIDYARFDVPAGTSVTFRQPSATAAVLNRVASAAPSKIDGTLAANGRVFFVNPSGVIFGPDSQVKAAGFTAAAANISTADFAAGVYRFTGAAGGVVADGRITATGAGGAHLLGSQVAVGGTISAPNGLVTLSAGGGATYVGEAAAPGSAAASTSVAVKVDPASAGAVGPGAGATGDVFALAIRRGATVRARAIEVQGGAGAGVVAVSGTLDASAAASAGKGAVGGSVAVTGDRVGLLGATVDASGPAGGGTVRVGGGYQGRGDLPHAAATVVDAASVVRADATARGPGGTVVAWSDHDTRVRGTVSARGGPAGGAGGRVETSGSHLDVAGATVAVDAPGGGAGGSWLLDPTIIIIRSQASFDARAARGVGDSDGPLPATLTDTDLVTPGIQFQPNPTFPSSRLTTESIAAQLNAGVSVTVDASAGPTSLQDDRNTGSIILYDVISKTRLTPAEAAGGASPTLTFNAPRLIRFAGTGFDATDDGAAVNDKGGILTTAGKLNVVLRVQDQVATLPIPFTSRFGSIVLSGDGIRTNGGTFTVQVVDAAGVPIVQPAPDVASAVPRAGNQFNQFVTTPNDPTFLVTNSLPGTVGAGGLIDTSAAGGGKGGDVTVDVPRAILMTSPLTTGGGNVNITASGPVGLDVKFGTNDVGGQVSSSPVVIPGAINTAGPAGVAGGDVRIRSTFDVQVRSIGTAGGDVTIEADTIKTGVLAGTDTDPNASTVQNRTIFGRGKFTLLLQSVVNFADTPERQADPVGIDAGTGVVTVTGAQLQLSNDVVGRGGITLAGDLRDRSGTFATNTDGPLSQFVGRIDAGAAPVVLRGGRTVVLVGGGIRGGDITVDALFKPADPSNLTGSDVTQVVVANDDYRISTTGGTVRIGPPVIAAQTSGTDAVPPSFNPALTLAAVGGGSADVAFDRSVGGAMRLVVDAGPRGTVTFGDGVGRVPLLIQSPGGPRYVAAPAVMASVDVRAAAVTFGRAVARATGAAGPDYQGLTLNEGVLAPDGSLFALPRSTPTAEVLATGPINVSADRIVLRGNAPRFVSNTGIAVTSSPIDRAAGASPLFAVPGGPQNLDANLTGLGFQLAGSNAEIGTPTTIVVSSGGNPLTIAATLTTPVLTIPASPRLTSVLTPVLVQTSGPQSVAEVIAGANPAVVRRADRAAAPSGSQVVALQNLGINAREPRVEDEVVAAVVTGRAEYDDYTGVMPDALQLPIASPRITAAQATAVLAEYRRLQADADGRRDALGRAWAAFVAADAEGNGLAFRAHLEKAAKPTADEAKALETLRRLRQLQDELALNPIYRVRAERALAGAFRPPSIGVPDFVAAIRGSAPVSVGASR